MIAYSDKVETPPLHPQIGFFGHAATLRGFDEAAQWLADRLAGQSRPRGCSS
jgi:hypothetical protein